MLAIGSSRSVRAGGGITKLRLEQEVADHGPEAGVDQALLASTHFIDRRLHVVVNAPLGHATQHTERMVVSIEQHLVRLGQVGAQMKCAAMAQFGVRYLQLGLLPPDDQPVLGNCSCITLPPASMQSSLQSN